MVKTADLNQCFRTWSQMVPVGPQVFQRDHSKNKQTKMHINWKVRQGASKKPTSRDHRMGTRSEKKKDWEIAVWQGKMGQEQIDLVTDVKQSRWKKQGRTRLMASYPYYVSGLLRTYSLHVFTPYLLSNPENLCLILKTLFLVPILRSPVPLATSLHDSEAESQISGDPPWWTFSFTCCGDPQDGEELWSGNHHVTI